MTRDDYPYPEDEFDALGADRTPQGVHRAPLPRWRQLLPFIIVLILAPTLAFVAVQALSGGGDDPSPTADTTTEPATDGEPTTEPTEAPTEEPTEGETTTEEQTSEEPAADLDRSIQVWVLNGSGVGGLAAETQAFLTEDGWEDVNAADYGRPQPSGTTLFYDNADQLDEAEALGDLLGITNLVESSSAADGDLVLVLRAGFELP
ncbi:LytR C-terminal domain-containing protein [Pseudactinotalea suaedae]|uniref:LytR C-terminal domain-containing protein n=1 Tax=Pseudactinotalea suaedae TaxID=1524924 RepID=UPI0012E154D6|nr:LytR C-terminal domain-containing protein [Pseudactinotalea suaedae]